MVRLIEGSRCSQGVFMRVGLGRIKLTCLDLEVLLLLLPFIVIGLLAILFFYSAVQIGQLRSNFFEPDGVNSH